MNIKTRTANLDDLDTLLEFEQGVITAERPFDPCLKPSAITYYDLKALLSNDDAHVIVIEDATNIIGCGYALIKKSEAFEKSEYYSYLGFMYVSPEFRGKGLNKQVINTLIDWSKKRGIFEIRLEVYEQNQPAVKAYEKLGFKPSTVKMRMDVS